MGIEVEVTLPRCTGCAHCKDVCPVNVFDLRPREQFAGVVDDPEVAAKFQFRAERSLVVNGPECIVCAACLYECEGECIRILDSEGHEHRSVYK